MYEYYSISSLRNKIVMILREMNNYHKEMYQIIIMKYSFPSFIAGSLELMT